MSYPVTKAVSFPKNHAYYGTKVGKFLCDTLDESKKLTQVKKIVVYKTNTGVSSHKVVLNDGTKMALCQYLYGQARRARLPNSNIFDLTKAAYSFAPRKAVRTVIQTATPQTDLFVDKSPTPIAKTTLTVDETALLSEYLARDIVRSLNACRLRDRPLTVLKQIKALLA